MLRKWIPLYLSFFIALCACRQAPSDKQGSPWKIYQTSASGDKLTELHPQSSSERPGFQIRIDSSRTFQTLVGFGGAFTESTAHLLMQMSPQRRKEILSAYFSDSGAAYSLTRTHMNSCDFSLESYSYAPVAGDTALLNFSIEEDLDDIVPVIKEAQQNSSQGFKVIASPWTAPPWMKDNNTWNGGKLLPRYYDTWARFFVKYAQAYERQGIPIWAFTVENEPLGNDANWESMHYTPEEMASFVKNYLGPTFQQNDIASHVLVYDQNRGEELEEWADVLLRDTTLLPYIYGTAVHWYTSTIDWFPESLQHTHHLAPGKSILHTEGCVDAEVPHWQNDIWYWSKEATDWGYHWAPEKDKPDHPRYVPAYRYARDLIGTLNNHVTGWVDWNMVLDTAGGPNLAENWCVAPVLVKPELDEVYYTPLYYVLAHFSKFLRPGAQRVAWQCQDDEVMVTAVKNTDGSVAVIVFNPSENAKTFELLLGGSQEVITIAPRALQTVLRQESISKI